MDRNINLTVVVILDIVALRKESVDRNAASGCAPSANGVALRKESVDRNVACGSVPSANGVALRKESVDRNATRSAQDPLHRSRSPQGERG